MQNSERFRQGVLLPLDDKSEEQLRANDIDSSTAVRFAAIPDQAVFAALCHLKLFDDINANCGVMIDEFEEEWVDASNLVAVLAIIDSLTPQTQRVEVLDFLIALRSLVVEAQRASRSVLFVL